MSNLTPYSQHEYRPLQLAPPLCPNQLIQPLIQQPSSGAQQQLQVIQPGPTQPSSQPSEYGQNASAHFAGIAYPPPSPFDWVVSTMTSLLHSQHATVLAKLNEASEQQLDLATKVQTLQQSTNALQQTVNVILENMQQVSGKVAKLGTDMSSRDATLAERLNTLDDAIDAWPIDVRLATGAAPVGELQTPPGSEADTRAQLPVIHDQSIAQAVFQDIPEQDQQPQSPDKLVQGEGPLDGHGLIQPELDGNSSPALQTSPGPLSIQQDTIAPVALTQSITDPLETSSRGRKNTGTSKIRRSNRQSKKRERSDGTMEIPASKKRAKTVPKREARVSGKTPRKSILPQFNWNSIPIQDEELEQLIFCDKCDQAYHWGCVNILPEDPILQVDTTWLCPPCEFEDQHGLILGRTHDPDAKCRPDCPVQDHAEDMFAIDSIIGRFPHSADPSGTTMQYLVKWEDYPVQRSTWTPENEIGQAARALIRDFEKAASDEDLDVSDKSQLVLLQEAKDGGWGYYTFPS
ncbi:PHD-finger protein [Rhizoctonia solani 123E]|uniref:PHD-finger protein n=1 Tax=Rhizoctonia solani 123E TaxID=1423351 RepID=A0A074RRC5_9AGAM|nr:PHD-finger protein [Rhizoctonia solani 123E]